MTNGQTISRRSIADLSIFSFAYLFIFLGAGSFQQFIIPYLEDVHKFTPVRASIIIASVYLSFLVFRVLVGYTVSFLGDNLSLILGSATYFLFLVLLYFKTGFLLLFFGSLVWGWGAAVMWTVSGSLILDISDPAKKHGLIMGIFYSATRFGLLLGIPLLGIFQTQFGTKDTIAIAGILTLTGVLSYLFMSRKKTRREKPSLSGILRVLFLPKAKIVSFLLFSSSMTYGLLLGLFSHYITHAYGILQLSFFAACYHVSRLVFTFFGSALSDRLGRAFILFLNFLLSAFGLIIPVLFKNHILMAIGFMALGMGGMVEPIANAIIGDSTKSERRHIAIGTIFMWRDLGIAIAIIAGVYMNEVFKTIDVPLLLFSVLFAFCAYLSVILKRSIDERI